jgi:CHAT domain-containing protein
LSEPGERAELAGRLAAADEAEQAALLEQHRDLADAELARALKALYDETRTTDPTRAARAASAALRLSGQAADPEVAALAAWTAGMAALHIDGKMERAIGLLDQAVTGFEALGQVHTAAATQVSRLHALAMLGRYDDAIAAGLSARATFLGHDDLLAVGKIEQNVGNIHFRRAQFQDAEQFYRSARERYEVAGDQQQLAQIDNNLGTVLMEQHRFRPAAAVLEQALARAESAGLEVTQTEIRFNLGCLSLFQGRYDVALDYLEQARRRYAALGMGYRAAWAEQELADAYLELNMAPEAAEIAARVAEAFAGLGMRAEQARARACQARASLLIGRTAEAEELLAEARGLYTAEGNQVGAAMVTLTAAQLQYARGQYDAAAEAAAQAEASFDWAGSWRRLLWARWLRGEAARAGGQANARELLEGTLRDAGTQVVPQVAQLCHTSLGLIAAAHGDAAAAARHFEQAVELIEALRAPLPAEEFRTAFFSDKLTPYFELTRLCLQEGGPAGVARGFEYVERARSRALVDMLAGTREVDARPRDAIEAEQLARRGELREELNWFYSQLNRAQPGQSGRNPESIAALQAAVRDREAEVLTITRRLNQRGGSAPGGIEVVDVPRLQRELGADTAVVEYFSIDGMLQAFVVTDAGVEVVRDLAREDAVEEAIGQLHFQLGALRHGGQRLGARVDQMAVRARHHLGRLYELVLRPIAERLDDRRLAVVPHRALHYVPFHALYDGAAYQIERREVVHAPSASVLRHCLTRPRRALKRALLVGVAQPEIQSVHGEIAAISPLFPEAVVLLDAQATLSALRDGASAADVLHLACHGQFRPDNPVFSSLHLADGWMTVRDAYSLDLRCELVTLSACETGVSAVAPGDELIGLARGFLSAQTPSLLVSLWTVDDESTAALMGRFYRGLHDGAGPAAALRQAQREMLDRYPHPFFWAPFTLLGRW